MIKRIQQHRMDVCAVIFLTAVVAVFFNKTITKGLLPVPSDTLVGLYHPWRDLYAQTNPRGVPFKNFLITDPVRQQIPWRKIVIDAWKAGSLPGWNPFSFSGTSLLANIQAASFYPFNILFFLFAFPDAWTILIILQPFLSMIFMYVYLRHLALSPAASVVGSVSWGLSGFNIAWLTWGTMGHVALWLPLILLAIDKKWSILLVLALTFQFFAGHAQISLYVTLLAVAYALFRRSRRVLFVSFIIAGIITAIQWIPLARFLVSAGRLQESLAWTKPGWFVPWQHAVQFVAPDFFGNPATLNYWGEWNYGEFIGYIGIVGLIFAFVAFSVENTLSRFFQLVAGFVALLMFPTILAILPYRFSIPILSSLQPTRMMVLFDFSLAVLAAIGMDFWMREKKRLPWKPLILLALIDTTLWGVVFFGGRVLPSLAESFAVSKRNLIFPTLLLVACISIMSMRHILKKKTIVSFIAAIFLIGITATDLLRFGWKFTPFTPREYFFPETRVISFLKQRQELSRIMSLDKRILPPNISTYFGIETPEGYDPLVSFRYEAFMAALERGKPDITKPYGFNRIITLSNIQSPLFPLLQVRYILSLDELADPRFKKVFEEGQTKIYEYADVLPRLYPVERVIEVKNEQEALDRLYDPSFHPRLQAVVETSISADQAPVVSSEAVRIVAATANTLNAQAVFLYDRFVVFLQAYDSKWRVFVDGKPTSLLRTDDAFSGFIVPKGSHTIQLQYSPLLTL